MPVGRDQTVAPARMQEPHAGVGRRAGGHENAEPAGRLRWKLEWAYATLDFFAAFAGGFGIACLFVFALSLATNSCLTFVVMAFTSTL